MQLAYTIQCKTDISYLILSTTTPSWTHRRCHNCSIVTAHVTYIKEVTAVTAVFSVLYALLHKLHLVVILSMLHFRLYIEHFGYDVTPLLCGKITLRSMAAARKSFFYSCYRQQICCIYPVLYHSGSYTTCIRPSRKDCLFPVTRVWLPRQGRSVGRSLQR